MERELQELTKEYQVQTKEIEKVRADRDFLENKVEEMENEKKVLRREIQSLETEVREKKASDESPSKNDYDDIDPKRIKELEDNIRLKNKQIHQLLEDIENLENDNEKYQDKIGNLRDELSEATGQINMIMGEYVGSKKNLADTKTLIDTLQQDNCNLKLKLEDQLKDKAKRESEIEHISLQVDKKVEEMKSICNFKDAKIEELTSRLNRTAVSSVRKEDIKEEKQAIFSLSKSVKERDDQIEKLQDKLQNATKDLESSALLIEELKGSKKDGQDPLQKSLMKVRSELYEAQKKVTDLKEQAQEAEESAKYKSEELSDALAKLRRYETGEYGLKEAIDEIKTQKKEIQVREKQCEELMNVSNGLELKNKELLDENSVLREKLGMEKTEMSEKKTSKTLANINVKEDRALVQIMHKEIERLEEERLHLKTLNRKLAQQLGQRAAKLGLSSADLEAIQEYTEALKNRRLGISGVDDSDPLKSIQLHETSVIMQKQLKEKSSEILTLSKDLSVMKTKYEEIFEENDKLREGMHEILDSVKEQDGLSDVVVTCPVLEGLLTILDARHYYGDYKPAMGLKAQMEKLEGKNAHLRDQCRKLRIEGDKLTAQNQKLRFKMQQMETELKAIKEENPFNQSLNLAHSQHLMPADAIDSSINMVKVKSLALPPQLGSSSTEIIQKLETQLIQVMDELETKDSQCKGLETEIDKLNKCVNTNKHQLGLLYNDHHKTVEDLKSEQMNLKQHMQAAEEQLEVAKAKNMEYEQHLQEAENAEGQSKIIDMSRKIVMLKANESLLSRKYKILEEQNGDLTSLCSQLKADIANLECHSVKTIGELQRYKEMYSFKVQSLQKNLEESVPMASFENANKQYNEITAKYRDLLQKQQTQTIHVQNVEELQLQVQNLREEKEVFKKELTLSKEKILTLESFVNSMSSQEAKGEDNSELVKLTKQVASLEVKELNERQKNDYLHNQNKLLQAQVQNMETRNNELDEKFEMISEVNIELQKVERDLRDQLITSIPKEEFDILNKKNQDLLEKDLKSNMEICKLKEIVDISQIQLATLELKKDNNQMELEALQHQILDLQTQTDEKALIGRLHQQVQALQVKEKEFAHQKRSMETKAKSLEANILVSNRKADELHNHCVNITNKYNNKLKTLSKVIQDLRRQYSGAIPLMKQEKLSKNLININEEKQKLSKMLKDTEAKLKDLEEKSEEMVIKQEGVDEVLSTLKNNTGAKQVLEWHAKLENLRIKELHTKRNAEHWEKEVTLLRDLCRTESRKAEQFEDEVVRLETMLEQKQLEYESKEMEAENFSSQNLKNLKEDSLDLSTSSENVPLAKQLDASLRKNRALLQELNELKKTLNDTKSNSDDLVKKLRDSEKQSLTKEKIINDLRDQLPSSVNRAVAITSVIGQPQMGAPEGQKTDVVAQATIESLKQRLKQKETTLTKYETMIHQSNQSHEEEIRKQQEEIVQLQNNIRSQQTALNELRSSKNNETLTSGEQIGTYVTRIQELEDEIQELQVSVGQLSSQLMESKKTNDNLNSIANVRLQELEEVKENKSMENQIGMMKQKELIDKLSNEVRAYQKENILLREDIKRLENISEAPAINLKSSVEKLKNDVVEKDKKIISLTKALTELKNSMIVRAESRSKSRSGSRLKTDFESSPEKDTRSLELKISEQNITIDKLKKQIKNLKDIENKHVTENSKIKELLEKKTSLVLKLKEEKMAYMKMGNAKKQSFLSQDSDDRQTKDLKNKIETLEEKLSKFDIAEKPFESDDINRESKMIKNAEEVARWEEKKKWQKKIEEYRERLHAADQEVSKMSKQNISLRETINRLEREKLLIEHKWKSHLKSIDGKGNPNAGMTEHLEQEIMDLKNKLENKKTEKVSTIARNLLILEGSNALILIRILILHRSVNQVMRL